MTNPQINLQVSPQLYHQLQVKAQEEQVTLEQLILHYIHEHLNFQPQTIPTIENNLALHQIVSAQQVFPDEGLVQVNGIFYRYLIVDNEPYQAQKNYVVLAATGNVLTLQALKPRNEEKQCPLD
ncbi:hypothetical protein HU830_08140 [Lactobacillus sp. DCY120]|uniref:Uncharacterized protein n=1 Tax=Bombilactobacillus apium TaxID=2675299 RepID=A0A850R1U2_9LACO|nr:hypothetical protein [Bombilactobacillus apium]NVY97089.1 hypothetical protein [Bombilactobacillus apium]